MQDKEQMDSVTTVVKELPQSDLDLLARMVSDLRPGGVATPATEEARVAPWPADKPIPLFDVQAGFGGVGKGATQAVSAGDCLRSLERLAIGGALVRTAPDVLEVDALLANDLLLEACEGHPELVPCPVVVPAGAGDLPSEEEQVDALIRRGAGAATIRPAQDDWQFLPFVYDALLRAVADRRLPLFCLESCVSVAQVAELSGRYAHLPILLANVHYRAQRTLVPLLAAFPNVHLALGSNFTVHRAIEQMVARLGPEQLLFGTGFPAAEPMMAVTQLMYAEIPGEHKALIGAGNAERLLAGVKR